MCRTHLLQRVEDKLCKDSGTFHISNTFRDSCSRAYQDIPSKVKIIPCVSATKQEAQHTTLSRLPLVLEVVQSI
jgi:hypothetical protein